MSNLSNEEKVIITLLSKSTFSKIAYGLDSLGLDIEYYSYEVIKCIAESMSEASDKYYYEMVRYPLDKSKKSKEPGNETKH